MRRLFSALLVSCSLAGPAVARADDAAVAEAQARFKEGLALADKAKFDEARLKFLQAYAVVKAPSVTFNLALAEQKTSHDVEAIGHYRAFLLVGANDTRVTDAMRDKARANITELAKKVGQIDIDAPEGTKVTVDGAPVESTKDPVAVTAGKHGVEGTYSGRVKSASVDAKVGEVTKATLAFDDPVVPPPANATPVTEPPPPAPTSRWSTAKIVTVSGLGAGAVAGVVLSVVFHAKAKDKVDQASSALHGGSCIGVTNSPTCDSAKALKDDRDSADTATTVCIVGAGVLGAGALAAALFWPTTKSAVGRVTPDVAPGYGGVNLSGRF